MAHGEGTVSTPAGGPRKPKGELWTALGKARTPKQLSAVEARAKSLRYAPDGQLRSAIAAKRSGNKKGGK